MEGFSSQSQHMLDGKHYYCNCVMFFCIHTVKSTLLENHPLNLSTSVPDVLRAKCVSHTQICILTHIYMPEGVRLEQEENTSTNCAGHCLWETLDHIVDLGLCVLCFFITMLMPISFYCCRLDNWKEKNIRFQP